MVYSKQLGGLHEFQVAQIELSEKREWDGRGKRREGERVNEGTQRFRVTMLQGCASGTPGHLTRDTGLSFPASAPNSQRKSCSLLKSFHH